MVFNNETRRGKIEERKMNKQIKLKQAIAVILAFAMLLTGIVPGTAGLNNVEASETAVAAQNEMIYFLNEKNEKIYMDSNNTFSLTTNDKGMFMSEGVSNPYWDCRVVRVPINGGPSTKSLYFVGENGSFNSYSQYLQEGQEVTASVTLREGGEFGARKLAFQVKITKPKPEVPYVELKAYVGDTEVTESNPYHIEGISNVSVQFKARKEGETTFEDVSSELLNIQPENTNYGRYDQVRKQFCILKDDVPVGFTVNLQSNAEVKTRLVFIVDEVAVRDFNIELPSEWEIDAWNQLLGDQYVGIRNYSVSFVPYNASNQTLKWENLTPKIADCEDILTNGIVPKKAGTAIFRVSSVQNPEVSKEVKVEFKYKYPLKKASVAKDVFDLKLGEIQDFAITTVPENATEQRFDWTYSTEGIVNITDSVKGDSSDASAEKTTVHTLRALKEGTVTVTGTPYDQSSGCKEVEFTVNVTKDGVSVKPVDIDKIVSDGRTSAIEYMNKVQKSYKYGDEWAVITKYRTGQTLDKTTLNAYYDSVANEVAKWDEDQEAIDIERVVLALSAMGSDPANVKGVNLIKMIYNHPDLGDKSNELLWGLLALDATDVKIPDNAKWSREKLINALLKFQNKNGGFGYVDNKTTSEDLTAMSLQALAPYVSQAEVAKTVDSALGYLRNKISSEYGYDTSETCSQVILALAALKMDPLKNGFGTEQKNIFSYFQNNYAVETGGFGHDTAKEANYMATYQALEAFEGYRRYAAGEDRFWNMKTDNTFIPDDNSPVVKPDDSKPGDSKPDNTKPSGTKPSTSKPSTSKPSTSKPSTSKPSTSKPSTSKPSASKPETTKPSGDTVKKNPANQSKTEEKKNSTTQKKTETKKNIKVRKPGRVRIKRIVKSGKKIKIQWKKVNGCTGYQVWMSNKKHGKYKLVKVKKGSSSVKCIVKLKKTKKVYIKVRAYKTIGTKKANGKCSKVKMVK